VSGRDLLFSAVLSRIRLVRLISRGSGKVVVKFAGSSIKLDTAANLNRSFGNAAGYPSGSRL
jgi:hypothetical protein